MCEDDSLYTVFQGILLGTFYERGHLWHVMHACVHTQDTAAFTNSMVKTANQAFLNWAAPGLSSKLHAWKGLNITNFYTNCTRGFAKFSKSSHL